MFLPIFDHPQSPQSLEMQSAILQVNQAHLLFLFTPDESQYVRERKKALLGYRESLVRDQLGAHNFFSSHKEYEKSVIQKSNLYYWREEQQKFLENEAVWQRLIQFSSHKPKLYAIRIKWQAHAALSRWNHQAILHVALNLLPKLMEYHQKELARCENLSLPQTTLDAYQSYLKKFLQQAEGLQKLIAESMFARLRALMIDGFKHADVTKEIIVQLQALGSVSPNMPVPSRFEEITPKQFVAFHGYLLQQKSVPLQEKMHTLGWLVDPTQLVSIVQPQAFRTLVVPTDLASDVPTGKRWPSWLFKGHNFRWKFFKDKGILLALLTTLSSEKAGTQIQDIEQKINQCLSKENKIQSFLKRLERQKYLFNPFWHRKTQHFIEKWQNWLIEQRKKIVSEKINCLAVVVDELQQQSKASTSHLIFLWKRCQWLNQVLQQLQQNCIDYQLSKQMSDKVKQMINSFTEILLMNKSYKLLKEMAKGELIQQSDLEFLCDFNQVTLLHNSQVAESFHQLIQPFLQKIYGNLKKELSSLFFQNNSQSFLSIHSDKILCFNYLVENFGNKQQKESIKNRLIKCWLHYLENIIRTDSSDSHKIVENIEAILILLGKKIIYGNGTVSSFVEEIKILRKKGETGLLTAKCKSLVLLINQDLLTKRLAKELTILDQGIAAMLRQDPELNFSDSNVNTVFLIRDKMVENNVSDVEKISASMLMHEKIIAGIGCEQTRKVKPLLKISAKMHRTFNQMKSDQYNNFEKHLKLKKLGSSVEKIFYEFPKTHRALQAASLFFNQETFLSKRYIDESVLSMPNPGNYSRIKS